MTPPEALRKGRGILGDHERKKITTQRCSTSEAMRRNMKNRSATPWKMRSTRRRIVRYASGESCFRSIALGPSSTTVDRQRCKGLFRVGNSFSQVLVSDNSAELPAAAIYVVMSLISSLFFIRNRSSSREKPPQN